MPTRALAAVLLLVAAGARAQDGEPAGPPADAEVEETPAPVDDDEDAVGNPLAADVARDAYLGGAGIVGPLALVSVSAFVAPVLGGVAAGWVSERSHPRLRGQWVRGAIAALVVMVVSTAMTVPLVVVTGVGSSVAGSLAGAGTAVVPLETAGGTGTLALVSGLGLAFIFAVMGATYVLVPLVAGAWAMITNVVSVKAGDLAWNGIWPDRGMRRASGRAGFLDDRVPGEPPLDVFIAGAVIAASAKGAAVRRGWLEAIPFVGPLAFYFLAGDDVIARAVEAREVSGHGGGRLVRTWGKPLLLARAILATAAGAWSPSLGLLLCGLGALSLAGGVAAPWSPLAFTVAMFGVLGGLGILVLAVAPLLATTFAAAALDAVMPWSIAWLALRGAAPIVEAEAEFDED